NSQKKVNLNLNVNHEQIAAITGIVLAGGKSSRLGREKALERIGGRRLIETVVDTLGSLSHEVLVVTSKEQFETIASINLKAKTVTDIYPDKAAFGGIYTGLINARTYYGLVVACDMPFLNRILLSYLVQIAPGFDIVIPRVGNKIEPLHAVYSKNCLTTIKKLLDENILQMLQLLDLVKTRYVDDDEVDRYDSGRRSFFNINTQNDLIEAKRFF
ncbi:molybdenum cofactor guanylyltransferase, partial [Chloroflexota bacterium]